MPVVPHIIDFKDCEWHTAREKMYGKCFQGENMTIQYGMLFPGHTPGPHKHEYEQIAVILSGTCDFFVDGICYHLDGGCLMDIPANVEHYVQVTGNDPCFCADIFWPKRPDRKESIPSVPFTEKKK